MRITRAARRETRRRIVAAARRLFVKRGFEETTTRALATEAGIAAGTLFNYFETKEALAMEILAGALEDARAEVAANRESYDGLEEALFAFVAAGLRHMRPYRSFVGAVFETAMSPFARSTVSREGDAVREAQLEVVSELLSERGSDVASFVTMHLFWTLYLGVVAFWSGDDSRNQEDTLAVLDQSIHVFAASLASAPSPEGVTPDPADAGEDAG